MIIAKNDLERHAHSLPVDVGGSTPQPGMPTPPLIEKEILDAEWLDVAETMRELAHKTFIKF